jgi:hypothetical protein
MKRHTTIALAVLFSFVTNAQTTIPNVPGSTPSRRTVATLANPVRNLTVPVGVNIVYFESCSPGGGRGGKYSTSAGQFRTGGGGGSGVFVQGYIVVSGGEVITITQGPGGANGTDGSSTTGSATPGTSGSSITITLSGSVILALSGGQGGGAGNDSQYGIGGSPGAVTIRNGTVCFLTSEPMGLYGDVGLNIGSTPCDFSGIGGVVPRTGIFNFVTAYSQLIEPYNTCNRAMVYLPYYGTGAGRGLHNMGGGYAYFYW